VFVIAYLQPDTAVDTTLITGTSYSSLVDMISKMAVEMGEVVESTTTSSSDKKKKTKKKKTKGETNKEATEAATDAVNTVVSAAMEAPVIEPEPTKPPRAKRKEAVAKVLSEETAIDVAQTSTEKPNTDDAPKAKEKKHKKKAANIVEMAVVPDALLTPVLEARGHQDVDKSSPKRKTTKKKVSTKAAPVDEVEAAARKPAVPQQTKDNKEPKEKKETTKKSVQKVKKEPSGADTAQDTARTPENGHTAGNKANLEKKKKKKQSKTPEATQSVVASVEDDGWEIAKVGKAKKAAPAPAMKGKPSIDS
jgi:hypothetical protein